MECSWDKYLEVQEELDKLPAEDVLAVFGYDMVDILRDCDDNILDMLLEEIRERETSKRSNTVMTNNVELISITPNYKKVLTGAISQCYQTDKHSDKALEHCIKAGHLSVLEHCYATFKVKCSIQTLLQLTRHRHLSFTVQSSRGTFLDEYLQTGDETIDAMIRGSAKAYNGLAIGGEWDFEQVALLAPKAMMYNLYVTGNFRAWFEYLPKRMCERTQKEHRELAEEIQKILAENAPAVFGRNMMACDTCKERSCSFHG